MSTIINKILKYFIYSLGVPLITLGIFLAYSLQPAIAPQLLKTNDIIDYANPLTALASQKTTNLKIITYNIGYASGDKNNLGAVLSKKEIENNLDNIIKRLSKEKPDLLLLQELDFNSKRTHHIDQLKALAQGLRLPYTAYAITWNKKYVAWPYWPLQHHFGQIISGQAILSRFPITEQKVFKFSKPSNNPFWYNWFYLDRVLQQVSIKIGKQLITIDNVHLEAFAAETRLLQLNKLSTWIQQNPLPLKIIAGDFNDDWAQEQNQTRLSKFSKANNLTLLIETPFNKTFPSWKPAKRIDYILLSRQWRVVKHGVITNLLSSDHLPVWAELEFNFRGQE